MKVLCIGNSFSEDATRYLHRIAKADGMELKTVNLVIGGCSLYAHYINMLEDRKNYGMLFNGEYTGFRVSIKEALISDNWDVITVQQVSSEAPNYETYQPYLNVLVEYVKKYCPKSKIFVHETWAYEQGSDRLCRELGYSDYKDMLKDIKNAYKQAAEDINADAIIPSGELFEKLLDSGIAKVHRDTFHASLGLGRYALGMLWYRSLTGKDVMNNTFVGFDEPVSDEDINTVKTAVMQLLK